jgi:hypothetical protein
MNKEMCYNSVLPQLILPQSSPIPIHLEPVVGRVGESGVGWDKKKYNTECNFLYLLKYI